MSRLIALAVVLAIIASPTKAEPLSLSQPICLSTGAVRCLRETVLAAIRHGYPRGGNSAAQWAVANLFVAPPLGYVRAPERKPVRLLAQADRSYSALANIEWTGQRDWLVFLSSLENSSEGRTRGPSQGLPSSCRLADDVARAARIARPPPCTKEATSLRLHRERR